MPGSSDCGAIEAASTTELRFSELIEARQLFSIMWTYKLILAAAIAIASGWAWQVGRARSATLLALDTHTGAVRWVQPLQSAKDFYSRGAIAAGGTVILNSAESSTPEQRFDTYRLQAFDTQSGDRLWSTQSIEPAEGEAISEGFLLAANPSIDLQAKALYAQIGGELRSIDPRTGQQRWAIDRPWFNTNSRRVWYGLGIATTNPQLAVLRLNTRQRLLQILDPATGRLLWQKAIALEALTTTSDRITASDRQVFLETSTLIALGNNSFRSGDRSTLSAYDIHSRQVRRTPIIGTISNLQAAGDRLHLMTDAIYDQEYPKNNIGRQLLGLDVQTGRVRWQRSQADLECFDFGYAWRVDAERVYLNCNRRSADGDSSTIVALSAHSGQVQWESQISPDRYAENLPIAVSERQLLTFRQVKQGNRWQTQAIALDRQTGRLLWRVALFDDRYVNTFRSIVATDRDRFFVLDAIPRWRLWLLRRNRHWSLKPSIVNPPKVEGVPNVSR